MLDYKFELANTRDEQAPQRDGSIVRQKRVEFFLGKHGPFVERMTDDEYHAGELERRVVRLRAKLQSLENV